MRSRITLAAIAVLLISGGVGGCSALTEFTSSVDIPVSIPSLEVASSKVVRVIDGDTIALKPTRDLPATNSAGTEHTVRLLGIDAPEMNKRTGSPECGAKSATKNLAKILEGETVTLTFDSRSDHTDRYGRSLAYVLVHDSAVVDVALQMVVDGYAGAWYPKGEPEPERFGAYEAALKVAEATGAGAHGKCGALGR